MPKLVHREKVPTDILNKICSFIKNGNTVETAARCSGIHRDTFYDWMKRGRAGEDGYKQAAVAVDLALAMGEAIDVATIRAASATSWQAAAWRLERRYPKAWGRKDHHHIVQERQIAGVDLARISDDELLAILAGSSKTDEPGESLDEEPPTEDAE